MKKTTVVLCATLAGALLLVSALTASTGNADPNAVGATDRSMQVSEPPGASIDRTSNEADRGSVRNDIGDANGDGIVDGDDCMLVWDYLFEGGPPPDPLESADVDCDGNVDVNDLMGLAGSVSGNGTTPGDTDGDGSPDC